MSDATPINYDDIHEHEVTKLICSYLWVAFETSAPDTPARIWRVILHALRKHGYDIIYTGGNMNESKTRGRDER